MFLSRHTFEKSKLIGINWTLADWSLPGFQKLIGFYDCVLNHSTLIGLELENLQIINCIAHEVDFRETNCSKADFKGTDLAKSIFGNTNLTKADLSQAQNYAIDPGNNILKKSKIRFAGSNVPFIQHEHCFKRVIY